MKLEKLLQWMSFVFVIATIPFIVWYVYHNYYPFVNSLVEQHIPINKQSYSPGETIEFHLNACYDGIKYTEVTYQLEGYNGGELYYLILGTYKSTSRKGCYKLVDLNARIPADFFEREVVVPGKHKLYIITGDSQNPTKPFVVYQTDWFYIEN